MSRIDDLIAEHCPYGVRFAHVGDVTEVRSGWGFPHSEQGGIEGEFPFFKVGDMNLPGNNIFMNRAKNYIDREAIRRLKISPAPRGTVIFPKIGAAVATNKKRILLEPAAYDNNVMGLIPGAELHSRFLLYWIQTIDLSKIANDSGAVPSIRKSEMQAVRIPVPPLEVQRAIVEVLDTFSKLEAELEAELEARKQQYEHYQNQLLSFSEGEADWLTLGDIGRVAMCKRIFKDETSPSGDVPFFKIGTFGGKPDAFISRELYDEYRNRFSFPNRGDILLSAAGTIGRAIPYDGEPAYFQDSNIVWLAHNESVVLNSYLRYWYRVVKWTTDGGTIKRLYNENLRKAKIAVPPLEEQHRIVAILDKFDALVNDLSIGLPAELAARRQQYKHYRDMLLTFKEAA